MKIDAFTIVFSGMDPEPYYAAAVQDGRSLWAVASGHETGTAKTVIRSLESLDRPGVTGADLKAAFASVHPALQRMKEAVSVAGVYSAGNALCLFNSGNARALGFVNGSLAAHTDDHSRAYQAYKALGAENAAAYEAIRTQSSRLTLTGAIGVGEDPGPQLYPPAPLRNNVAVLLCTEPFWRFISVMEMELDYRKSAGAEEWLKTMARRVLMRSDKRIDNENFAAAAVVVAA